MAADTSTGSFSFTVNRWLKAVDFPEYTTAFTTSGHVNYGSCINLSEEELRAVGVKDDDHVRLLMNRVKELRKLSEEDAANLLWVSSRKGAGCCVCHSGRRLGGQGLGGANVPPHYWNCKEKSTFVKPFS